MAKKSETVADTVDDVSSADAAVVETEPTEAVEQPVVTFLSDRYPYLRVLIERLGGIDKEDYYACFVGGEYKTSDPKAIAALDKVSGVVRDTGVRYPCPLCNFSTRYAKLFSEHMSQAHPQ
jgi:hypothetical protein